MMEFAILAILTAIIAVAYIDGRKRDRDKWHNHALWPLQRVRFLDGGETRGGIVMRRFGPGRVPQYRRMRVSEETEYRDSAAM